MNVVECPIRGTYLVRDESQPIPFGQTEASFSVVVHQYPFGWVCQGCGSAIGTTRPECEHVKAAKEVS